MIYYLSDLFQGAVTRSAEAGGQAHVVSPARVVAAHDDAGPSVEVASLSQTHDLDREALQQVVVVDAEERAVLHESHRVSCGREVIAHHKALLPVVPHGTDKPSHDHRAAVGQQERRITGLRRCRGASCGHGYTAGHGRRAGLWAAVAGHRNACGDWRVCPRKGPGAFENVRDSISELVGGAGDAVRGPLCYVLDALPHRMARHVLADVGTEACDGVARRSARGGGSIPGGALYVFGTPLLLGQHVSVNSAPLTLHTHVTVQASRPCVRCACLPCRERSKKQEAREE